MAPRHAQLWYYMYFPVEFVIDSLRNKHYGPRKNNRNKSAQILPEDEVNVEGKVVVITGANSGIGKCVATEMAKRGAIVVMGCRDLRKGELAQKEIMEKTGSVTVELYHLDLADFTSVRSFANTLLQNHSVIDILINNAGISLNSKKQQVTKEGWDLQMTTNHLGHFLLTNLLINAMLPSPISRIVNMSSTGCVPGRLDPNDIMLERESKNKLGFWYTMPYQNSKLANALFTKSLAKKYPSIKSYSLCPGLVRTEILHQYEHRYLIWPVCQLGMSVLGTGVEKGADTVLLCSLGKRVEKDSGGFFRFGKRLQGVEKMLKDELAEDLWNVSEKYVGLK